MSQESTELPSLSQSEGLSSSLETKNDPNTTATSSPAGTSQSSPKLKLQFQEQNGQTVFIMVSSQMPFSKIFKGYTTKRNVDPRSVRFLFDGTRINETDTPKSLEMQNEDVIDVLAQQTGG